MRNRNVVTVDGGVMHTPRLRPGIEVCHELMAEEVEVDPLVRAPARRTAEQAAVETHRVGQVVDGNREMKRREIRWHGGHLRYTVAQRATSDRAYATG